MVFFLSGATSEQTVKSRTEYTASSGQAAHRCAHMQHLANDKLHRLCLCPIHRGGKCASGTYLKAEEQVLSQDVDTSLSSPFKTGVSL